MEKKVKLMYRKGERKPERIDFNIAFTAGGMGDAVASLPVFKYILEEHTKNHHFTFWLPDYFVDVAKFCFPKALFNKLSEKHKFNERLPTFHTNIVIPSFLRQHLTDYASLLLADIILPAEKKNYFKPNISKHNIKTKNYELYKILKEHDLSKFVFITSMYTSDTRVFRGKEVNKIVDYIIEREYTPVFIGKEKAAHFEKDGNFIRAKQEEIDTSKGLNLINKTSLLDLIWLFDKGKSIIGLDNGLLHLACMTDLHVIGAYTSVHPDHRLPYRYNEKGWNYDIVLPDEDLGCAFCQSNWCYDVKQNFTKCFYEDYKCCDQITADKFINILKDKL